MSPTLLDLLTERADQQPGHIPYVELDRDQAPMTARQLRQRAHVLGAWLREHYPSGSRVLLCFPAGPDFAVAFFGCLTAGMIAVPAPPPLPGPTAEHFAAIAADCTPRLVLTREDWLPLLTGCELRVEAAEQLRGEGEAPSSVSDPQEIAFLAYTAGTAGPARGAVFTHRAAMNYLRDVTQAFGFLPRSPSVGWLPVFHDMGLCAQLLIPLSAGFQMRTMDPFTYAHDPGRWLTELSRCRSEFACIPGTVLRTLVRKVPEEQRTRLDLSGLRALAVGMESTAPDDLAAFTEAFAVAGFDPGALVPVYGGAEVFTGTLGTPGVGPVVLRVKSTSDHRFVMSHEGTPVCSSGRPLPGRRTVIADPHTRELLPAGEVGEVLVAGDNLCIGYWNGPDPFVDVAGRRWLATGDLGAFIEGELYVRGRLSNRITVAGRPVHLPDVERAAATAHPELRAHGCAAFAGPSGVVLVAEATPYAETADTVRAITAAVREHCGLDLADVAFVRRGELARTTSGKLRRHVCRERYLERQDDTRRI
jgi:nonribosomal peptide synthetase protein BlmVI